MASEIPSREWLQRFADASERYRAAFIEVQRQLREAELGRIPVWCFAIDRMAIEDVRNLSPALYDAEDERRRWRVALHALAELIALNSVESPVVPEAQPAETPEAMLESMGDGADAELDQFITVINYAKNGGVIYVNGTFEPLARGKASQPPIADQASSSASGES